MWLINRQKTDNQADVPTEIQEYYQSGQRERRWVAWALAAVTLIVTVGVVLGLFFGGRALYRVVRKNKPTTTTSKPQPASTATNPSKTNTGTNTTPNATSQGTVNAPANPLPNPKPNNSTASQQPSNSTTATPNTGPGETAAVGFTIASIVGFGVYELRLRRKLLR